MLRAATGALPLGPVVDGELHPWTVEEGLRAGAGRDVPLLVGSTRQEFSGLALANRHLFEGRDLAGLLAGLGLSAEAARRCPARRAPGRGGRPVRRDAVFRRRVVEWLELRRAAASTWAYDFAWRSAVSGIAEHCLDVPFVFDLLEDPDVVRVAGRDAPQALADRVHGAFVRFVRGEEPSWPASAGDSRAVMAFDADPWMVASGYASARARPVAGAVPERRWAGGCWRPGPPGGRSEQQRRTTMGRTYYFTASSLDGFIATPDHELDWLLKQDFDPRGPMGFEAFMERVGAMAMGASTYRWILDHHEWSYTVPTWVFTHREFPPPTGDVQFTTGDVAAVHREMTVAAGDQDIWLVGGGELVGQFADRGLLDEVWVQYAPVTLGGGAPLLPRRLDLELVDVARNGAFLCGRYSVTTPSGG